ncbi:hypothetical protein NT6N_21240 [Oceaniferula spumae]|uniref:Alpha-galactosidase n=1 Tax=Oceaniferula spumae TaxID=2979115 RepID=A0AAT9FMD7_9BACT
MHFKTSLLVFLTVCPISWATAADATHAVLENQFLKRTIATENGVHTQSISNKLDGKSLTPKSAHAFVITLADDTTLTSTDFETNSVTPSETPEGKSLTIQLTCKKIPLKATLSYQLKNDAFYCRKTLSLTPGKALEVKQIDLESLELTEAYQPYTISQITAKGAAQWRPGLGQPLYTKTSGTFWGVEFPASMNTVKDGTLRCSYLVGKTLPAGKTYQSHTSVLGVADSPDFVKEAFFNYIDQTRIRPLRLQTQYNSWFDYGKGVSSQKFTTSIKKVHNELNTKRGVPPLSAYVIDDGWQNTSDDWSKKAWTVNGKFDPNFTNSFKAATDAESHLGLWLSPGCIFGGQPAIPKMRAAGFKSLDPWMSLSAPGYTDKLEERMVELTEQGVTYFKLDGVFGHLNTRNFDVEGFKGSEKELNDAKYDQQKIQYLTDGSERLIKIFQAMHKANPDVYIVISNGAWLSPFWLQHIDAVWMINAGDAAGGANRTGELVYRDAVYHDLAVTENTQFPLHSIFNHEPKKTKTGESKETFRRYLYMNMSRGTGFVELYIKPFVIKEYDWDVLAEGLLWVHDIFPTFKHSRMHGGRPKKGEVYGYTAWLKERGFVSIHNPSNKEQTYTLTLDRKFGLTPDSKETSYLLSSPISDSLEGLKKQYRHGDTISVDLKPGEIRILNFDTEPRDWKQLTDLQTRTKQELPKPVSIQGHAILGTWKYGNHQREFKVDGTCTLTSGKKVQWTKPFTINSPTQATVQGGYKHVIQKDGSLRIEGKYTATKGP